VRPPPRFVDCFRFPIATRAARRDLLIGGALLLTTLPGWILNMGHRLEVVYRVWHAEEPAFRGFAPVGTTFRRGLVALASIAVNLAPAAACALLRLWIPAGILFLAGIFILPGGQTRNAAFRDTAYLFRPDRALRVALVGGRAYLKAWLIGAVAIALSFLGLLAGGIGFFWTSVWAWTVVGYAFTRALQDPPA
jgi:hypothetical protein